ncbi:hypothetical protein MHYP_G00247800 [Metynnis hypsauchen]
MAESSKTTPKVRDNVRDSENKGPSEDQIGEDADVPQEEEWQNEVPHPRRGERIRTLTEKAKEMQDNKVKALQQRFNYIYQKWRIQAKFAKKQLSQSSEPLSENLLNDIMGDVRGLCADLQHIYEALRGIIAPDQDTRRTVDRCVEISSFIVSRASCHLSGNVLEGKEQDWPDASSLWNSSKSEFSSVSSIPKNASEHSRKSSVKRQEAAADAAASQAVLEVLQEQEREQLEIQHLEAEAKRKLAAQEAAAMKCLLEQEAEEMKRRIKREEEKAEMKAKLEEEHNTLQRTLEDKRRRIQHLEIVKELTSARARMQVYVCGQAKNALEGYFLLGTESAYASAWEILEERYGNPFTVAKAYRDKLQTWPKIGAKDSFELREFVDFLRSCEAAMVHIKALEILDDCNENRKILSKLPDWLIARWSRKVLEIEEKSNKFPSFSQFVEFLTREAKIACNPVTSLQSLKQVKQPAQEVLVYALLDTQSDTTFVLREVADALEADKEQVKLKLSTMTSRTTVVSSQRMKDLQVRGFYSSKKIFLPPAYTRDFIPVNRAHIPTGETAKAWPHLEHLQEDVAPLQDCEVGLLIGYNCSQALLPREVVSGKENEPYAQRTDLGWSIVGCRNPFVEYGDAIGISHRVVVKQVTPYIEPCSNLKTEVHYVNRSKIKEITPSDILKVLESDFSERAGEEDSVSQDDLKFLSKMGENIKQKDDGCSNFGLKHLAAKGQGQYSEDTIRFIQRNFYVDDGLASVNTDREAIQLVKESRELCSTGKLRLHKFVSNNENVMASIPEEERATVKDQDMTLSLPHMERVLGVEWCITSDSFKFRVQVKTNPLTRRGVLSTVASVYDPLGFIAPFVLLGKQVLQQMCREKIGWDNELPESLRPQWESWIRDLPKLSEIEIKRCYLPSTFHNIKRYELHHFSDASISGYGECTYLRVISESDEVHCSLVMGKSRVTPTKVTTIPRLELTAAVVAVRASDMLRNELEIQDLQEY